MRDVAAQQRRSFYEQVGTKACFWHFNRNYLIILNELEINHPLGLVQWLYY